MKYITDSQYEAHQGLSFVNISRPHEIKQRAKQKVIRRHVMGRVGRARRKRPVTFSFLLNSPSVKADAPADGNHFPPRWQQIQPSLLPFGPYPVNRPDSRALQLIQFSTLAHAVPHRCWRLTTGSAHGGRLPLPPIPARMVLNGRPGHQCILPITRKRSIIYEPNGQAGNAWADDMDNISNCST